MGGFALVANKGGELVSRTRPRDLDRGRDHPGAG
jgi:hypothetical protein